MTSAVISHKGKSEWRIVRVSPASEPIDWAVAELRKYLRRIGGCDLPVVDECSGGPGVVVGLRADFPSAAAALLPPPAQGFDGYALAITAKGPKGLPGILIAGDNERGVIYGVYDLLERIGCRWFYPTLDPADPEVVPRLETIALPEGKRAIASPLRYRLFDASGLIYVVHHEMAKAQTDAAMKQRYNGMAWQCETKTDLREQYDGIVASGLMREIKKRGMVFQGPLHCFHFFLKTEDHFKDHPEWFGMRAGQRVSHSFGGAQFCWSNAEARKAFCENVARFVKACPEIDILKTSAIDGGQACQCPECAKVHPSDNLLLVFNELCERLAKEAPHVTLESYGGYPPVQEPPKHTKLHPRLRLLWAHWGRNHDMGFDNPAYDYKWNLDMWRKATEGHGMTICLYYTDHFAEPWIAAPYAIALAGDRKYIVENKIDAIYMLEFPEGYWWNCGLNAYLGGICYYDAGADPFDVIRDYALCYYGEKAGPLMASYFDEWARNVGLAYRARGGASDADRAQLAEQRRKYIGPAAAAAKGDPVLSRRVGKIEKLHAAAERLMAIFGLLRESARLREAGDFAAARGQAAQASAAVEETAAYIQSLIDLDQGLIDPQLLQFFYPRVRNQLAEEIKAIEAGSKRGESGPEKKPSAADMVPDDATD